MDCPRSRSSRYGARWGVPVSEQGAPRDFYWSQPLKDPRPDEDTDDWTVQRLYVARELALSWLWAAEAEREAQS